MSNTLIHFIDYIRLEHDKGNVVGMVLLDLQKAFDIVNHSILLSKLKACGLGNDICHWFSSYLSERKQLVDILEPILIIQLLLVEFLKDQSLVLCYSLFMLMICQLL